MIEQIERLLLCGEYEMVDLLLIGQPSLKMDLFNKYKQLIYLNQLSIFSLFEAKKLIINMKVFKNFPIEVCSLKKLEYLGLLNWGFSEIPKEISNLTNLKYLYLSENKIKEIPKEISNLTKLEYFDLSRNKIKEIPIEIANLNNLIHLNVHKNKLGDNYDFKNFYNIINRGGRIYK